MLRIVRGICEADREAFKGRFPVINNILCVKCYSYSYVISTRMLDDTHVTSLLLGTAFSTVRLNSLNSASMISIFYTHISTCSYHNAMLNCQCVKVKDVFLRKKALFALATSFQVERFKQRQQYLPSVVIVRFKARFRVQQQEDEFHHTLHINT